MNVSKKNNSFLNSGVSVENMVIAGIIARPETLCKVPENFRTYHVCIEAVRLLPANIIHVPNKIFINHMENFLMLQPRLIDYVTDIDIGFLYNNKKKLKRVIQASPDILVRHTAILPIWMLIIKYDEELIGWVEKKFPDRWYEILNWKKHHDSFFVKNVLGNKAYTTNIHGTPTKYGLRVTWK